MLLAVCTFRSGCRDSAGTPRLRRKRLPHGQIPGDCGEVPSVRERRVAPDGGTGWIPSAGSGKHTYLNEGRGLLNASGGAGTEYETGWAASDDSEVAPTNANLAPPSTSYATWTSTAGSQESLPINYVNWYEAYAFCIWDGGFLPSEAEWEYAAAGGSQQREYPWGSTDPGAENQYAIYNSFYSGNSKDIAPVGTATLGAGRWGQLDMAGETWEWNLDGYAAFVDPCTDCAYLMATSDRVLRGGNSTVPASILLPSYRFHGAPAGRDDLIGFRCARAP
jgi:formylglycine-generating enzyme